MDDEVPKSDKGGGAPPWIMTFADLMSLLMTFFVLLLSFSEMDIQKYKQLAGSMKQAFGVQREVKVKEPPKGINVIAREFSPGRPVPTPLNIVKQNTTDYLRRNLFVPDSKAKKTLADSLKIRKEDFIQRQGKQSQRQNTQQQTATGKEQQTTIKGQQPGHGDVGKGTNQRQVNIKAMASSIRKSLRKEIQAGSLQVLTENQKIVIRIAEHGSFPPGQAKLTKKFSTTGRKIAAVLKEIPGIIEVGGHTDSIPISTRKFASNWELSADRAIAVLEYLQKATGIPDYRFRAVGYADSKPLASNGTASGRAKNRRVELTITQGNDRNGGKIRPNDPNAPPRKVIIKQPRNNGVSNFNLPFDNSDNPDTGNTGDAQLEQTLRQDNGGN